MSGKLDKTTIKKIGSVPIGYGDKAVVFIKEGKIYIGKPEKKAEKSKDK